jgi:hypothetical protein
MEKLPLSRGQWRRESRRDEQRRKALKESIAASSVNNITSECSRTNIVDLKREYAHASDDDVVMMLAGPAIGIATVCVFVMAVPPILWVGKVALDTVIGPWFKWWLG